MRYLRYKIELVEPLQLKSYGGDTNTTRSLGFIPGSVIRGAIIGNFICNNQESFSPNNEKVRRLFFSDSTCFLNAYPYQNEQRFLPTPLSLKFNKDDAAKPMGRELYDLAVIDPDDVSAMPLQPEFSEFLMRSSKEITLYSSKRILNPHIRRASLKGAPTKNTGAIFHQECLSEGQIFQGIIIAKDDKDLEEIKANLSKVISLGGSKGGGYGQVKIDVDDIPREVSHEVESISYQPDREDLIFLTLTSPATLRNHDGITVRTQDQFQRFLSEWLGVSVKIERAFVKVELTGGFNRKWKLPLPNEYSLSAGSVIVLKNTESSILATLQELALTGLGERRNEGFGRFCINLQGDHENYAASITTYSKALPRIANIDEKSPAYTSVQILVNRLARTRMESLIQNQVDELIVKSEESSKSQINRLRNITEHLLNQKANGTKCAQELKTYLNSVKDRQDSRKQLEKAKVDYTNLLEWIEKYCAHLENPADRLWNKTQEDVLKINIGGINPDLSTLEDEYKLKFIHSVLLKLAK
jgi:CRISPR-associated protein Csx10